MEPHVRDSELIGELQQGSEKVFSAIYYQYHQAVLSNICRLVPNQPEAEDLLQEVFITLWNNRLKLTPAHSIAGWLFSTSYYKSLEYLRKAVRIAPITDTLHDALVLDDHPYQAEKDHQDKLALLMDAIELLPAKKKQATIGVLQTDFAIKKETTLNGLTQNQGQLDVPILRYADLLLMQAEAENEVNGPTPAAYSAINQVRARAVVANVTPGLTKDAFRTKVIHERRVEFAFEGQRWLDLVTLGIANQKINAIGELGRKFLPNQQELFPIPQSERNLNPNLSQNPGY